MLRLALCIMVAACSAVYAQGTSKILDFNPHGWYSYSGDHAVRGLWGVHFDAQWRRSNVITRWQQYQLRPGVNYQVWPRVLLTLGYAFTRSYPYGEFPVRAAVPEHRVYQQALIRMNTRVLGIQHRIRLEQRFIKYADPQPRSWTYQNRFRYLIRAELPLTRKTDGSTRWYLPAYNEIVIGLPPNYGARPFDQNRLFIGIGYAAAGANIDVGYLNQFLAQRNGRVFEFNNTLFVGISSRVPLTKLWRK
jgi:hypothetical protein